MSTFEKILVILWFWFKLAIRGLLLTVFGLTAILVAGLLGCDPDKIEKAYLHWLFFGEFKSK
jgi:hypothetical protein